LAVLLFMSEVATLDPILVVSLTTICPATMMSTGEYHGCTRYPRLMYWKEVTSPSSPVLTSIFLSVDSKFEFFQPDGSPVALWTKIGTPCAVAASSLVTWAARGIIRLL